MTKKHIIKKADYDPETGKGIPRPEWLLIVKLRKKVKRLESYIINDAILKQKSGMNEMDKKTHKGN